MFLFLSNSWTFWYLSYTYGLWNISVGSTHPHHFQCPYHVETLTHTWVTFYIILTYFIDYTTTVAPFFFFPLFPFNLYHPSHHHFLTLVHVHRSYIQVLWLLHLPYYSKPPRVYFVPTIYSSYSLNLSPHSPLSFSPLLTLHVISISVNLFLF